MDDLCGWVTCGFSGYVLQIVRSPGLLGVGPLDRLI